MFSCSNISYLLQHRGDIYCYGEKSCFGSTIIHNSSADGDWIYCMGYMSCSNTIITTQTGIWIFGYLSLSHSIIYGNGDVEINFRGVSSGLGTKIICGIGSTCEIGCWTNGCNSLTVECEPMIINDTTIITTDTCTINIACSANGAEQSHLCPDGYNTTFNVQTPSLTDLEQTTASTVQNSFDFCAPNAITSITNETTNATTNVIHCQDDSQCSGNTIESRTGAPICCTGYKSCFNSSNITTNYKNINFWNSSWGIDTSIAIRCDGYKSCQDVKNVQAIDGGNIYFTGTRSGGSNSHDVIKTTGDYDVICSGYASCEDNSIQNANNLYCFGYFSCDDLDNTGEISNIQNNVYMYAGLTSRQMHFRNIFGNVYCGGRRSCYIGDFNNIGGFIYGSTYRALYYANIFQVNESIIAFGYGTMLYATVSDIKNDVICKGLDCAEGSSITNVNGSVIAKETKALYDATISNTRNVSTVPKK